MNEHSPVNSHSRRTCFRIAVAATVGASLLVPMGAGSSATELSVDGFHIAANEEAVVSVRATPPDGIVAAAFTVIFDTSALEVAGWETPLFPDFETLFHEDDGNTPRFGDSFEHGGETFERPVAVEVIAGLGLRFAALRLIPAASGEDRLVTLRLRLSDDADPGFFPLEIEPTVLTLANAGYPSEGDALPPVLSLVGPTADRPIAEYLPLLTAPDLETIKPGALVIFAHLFSDTTDSGLDDAWEIRYFGATRLTDAFEDFDGDGLPNLLEKFHGGNPRVPGSVPRQTARVEDGHLILRFPMAPTLLERAVETTANPASGWTEIPTEETTLTLRPDLGQTADWTMAELTVPLPPSDRAFFRLRVTTP